MQALRASLALALPVMAAIACQPVTDRGTEDAGPGPTPASTAGAATPAGAAEAPGPKFDAIRADETISFVGTEPFWGGKVGEGRLTYSTPENQDGETVAVQRFAGNNGLGFSGTLQAGPFDLTITPGACSDGMSDRSYPYAATLKIGEEQRNGCAWTERQPFSGPANP